MRVLRGRLGISFSTNQPVTTLIGQRLPATLILSGAGLVLAVGLAGQRSRARSR